MVFLENALSSKFNPLVTLGRSGSFGTLKGFVNRFNGDAELLDDLVLIRSPLSLFWLIVVCRTTIGRPSTTRSLFFIFYFSFGDDFQLIQLR
jgi:hypothetical protein